MPRPRKSRAFTTTASNTSDPPLTTERALKDAVIDVAKGPTGIQEALRRVVGPTAEDAMRLATGLSSADREMVRMATKPSAELKEALRQITAPSTELKEALRLATIPSGFEEALRQMGSPSAAAQAVAHADRLQAAIGLREFRELFAGHRAALTHLQKREVVAPSRRDLVPANSTIETTTRPDLNPPTQPIATSGDLGQLVRNVREQRKMSQQDFADLAGVGRRFLSELENGKTTLEFDKVVRVASAAGIDLVALIRR